MYFRYYSYNLRLDLENIEINFILEEKRLENFVLRKVGDNVIYK